MAHAPRLDIPNRDRPRHLRRGSRQYSGGLPVQDRPSNQFRSASDLVGFFGLIAATGFSSLVFQVLFTGGLSPMGTDGLATPLALAGSALMFS
jgi:hypothetical protein